VTLSPAANYARMLDSDIRHAVGAGEHFWAGLSLALSF
jgi:hypothetical protein